jgi:serine/threonine-protein kinase/endoribonuclease IRE1
MVTIVEPESSAKTENAGDEESTPVKKKTNRRRVRGKKKRRDSNAALLDDKGEGEDDDEDGADSSSPPQTVAKRDDKPLPELPREMSSTALADNDDKERLSISDCCIGKRVESRGLETD